MPRIIKSAKGTFTSATITVDSDGRVVAASAGASAGGDLLPTKFIDSTGPTNYTSSPNSGNVLFFTCGGAGGPGGGGAHNPQPRVGGTGGNAPVRAFYVSTMAGGATTALNIGAKGTHGIPTGPGNGTDGAAGNATVIGPSPAPLFTTDFGNAGEGAPRTGQGNPGNTNSLPSPAGNISAVQTFAVDDEGAKLLDSAGVPSGPGASGFFGRATEITPAPSLGTINVQSYNGMFLAFEDIAQ